VTAAIKQRIDAELVERWQKLVSDSNWDKGEVIASYSANGLWSRDDEFSHIVGGVEKDYLRVLRLVWDRFSDVRSTYPSLRWTHFYVALEWPDACVWLRRADVEHLTPSEMSRTRLYELVAIEKEKKAAAKGE
jgi:hypothetical protein